MEKFTTLRGVAAPLPMVNVDTDMIIPKNFLKTIKRTGLKAGPVLRNALDGGRPEEGLRARPAGLPERQDHRRRREFRLRIEPRARARGRCSTSASAASSSEDFADIFYNNCFKNGILPIKMPKEIIDKLMDDASAAPTPSSRSTSRSRRSRDPTAARVHFDIDPFRKHCLLNGLDDIGLTMEKKSKIDDLRGPPKDSQPWLHAAS